MRVVNLSKRPFVNRRPLVRLAILLWLAGAVLLGINISLYSDHWQGTAENRQRLSEVNEDLDQERQSLVAIDQKRSQVRLSRQNRKAAFLNTLISQRAFPWSALFDRLEEVTPYEVRLVAIQPVVRIAGEDDSESVTNRRRRQKPEDPIDAVELQLTGWAKNEEALSAFVDTLYADPLFGPPVLRGESFEREVRFSLATVFYLRDEEEAPAEESPELAEGTEETVVAEEVIETGESEEAVTAERQAILEETSSEQETAPVTRAAPQPSTPAQPRRISDQEELEAVRTAQAEEIRQRQTPPPSRPSTRPSANEERQRRLAELRARSRARAAARGSGVTALSEGRNEDSGRRPTENETRRGQTDREDSDQGRETSVPEDEEDDRDDTNPPASSTPRVRGAFWYQPDFEELFESYGFSVKPGEEVHRS